MGSGGLQGRLLLDSAIIHAAIIVRTATDRGEREGRANCSTRVENGEGSGSIFRFSVGNFDEFEWE